MTRVFVANATKVQVPISRAVIIGGLGFISNANHRHEGSYRSF
jgi:hypothetical protein